LATPRTVATGALEEAAEREGEVGLERQRATIELVLECRRAQFTHAEHAERVRVAPDLRDDLARAGDRPPPGRDRYVAGDRVVVDSDREQRR
jgi:hypothetical protein